MTTDAGTTDWGLLSSYGGLLSLAALTICTGSFSSLLPQKRPRDERTKVGAGASEDSEDEEDVVDRFTATDAYLFPVFGSIALFGMYMVIKFYGKEWINWFLGWYFTIAGVGSVWRSSIFLAKAFIGHEQWRAQPIYRFIVLKGHRQINTFACRGPSLLLLPIAIIPSILYSAVYNGVEAKPVLLTNILALSFAHNAISLLKLDTFRTGCVMLTGLFLYDIWWVFGTEVMVKVAVSLDLPIKIMWPKTLPFMTAQISASERSHTMLGLGDIVVPGVFVATALRYDFARSGNAEKARLSNPLAFGKPYFLAALYSYVAGLMLTMAVMHIWGHAQPALLYLSPACILSFFTTALARGELTEAWAWTDEQKIIWAERESGAKESEESEAAAALAPATSSVADSAAKMESTDGGSLADLSASYVEVAARERTADDGTDRDDGEEADEETGASRGRKRRGTKKRK